MACEFWDLDILQTEHFCCLPTAAVLASVCIWQTHFPSPRIKIPISELADCKCTPKSALVSLFTKAISKEKYIVMAVMDTLKSMLTHKKATYQLLKVSWNKLFKAVCCFGLYYRLLFVRVKHGESHSPPASAALALPTQLVLPSMNQFQRLEHCVHCWSYWALLLPPSLHFSMRSFSPGSLINLLTSE